jgi:hypothetical protein
VKEQRHNTVLVLLGDRPTTGHPIIDVRVALFEQALELAQLLVRELCEMSICKGAYQQIGA